MAYSPEEAQAAVAALVANPIPATARQTRISGGAFNSWDIRFIPGQAGRHFEDVRIEDQEAEPTNPGIREVTASTYGQTIPVSLGRRRLPGNILQATQMIPRLVGGRDYEITYKVPMYADPPDDKPLSVDINPEPDRPRPDPENPPDKCGGDCDHKNPGAGGPGDPDPGNPPDPPEDVSYVSYTTSAAECCNIATFTYEDLQMIYPGAPIFDTYAEAVAAVTSECGVVITIDAGNNEVARSGCITP